MQMARNVDGVCEIEVKYRVVDLGRVQDALAGRGIVLSTPTHQDDQAYAPGWWEYGQSKLGVPFARLRTESGRHLFTVKTPQTNEQVCREQETLVADREQMHAALLAMGFRPTVRIVKTRRTATVGSRSLCLDQVEGAGVFLEVEQIVGTGAGHEQAQQKLADFVAGLGGGLQRVSDTYDSLIRAAQPVNNLAPSGVHPAQE